VGRVGLLPAHTVEDLLRGSPFRARRRPVLSFRRAVDRLRTA